MKRKTLNSEEEFKFGLIAPDMKVIGKMIKLM